MGFRQQGGHSLGLLFEYLLPAVLFNQGAGARCTVGKLKCYPFMP